MISTVRVVLYQLASALAGLSVVLMIAGWIAIAIHLTTDPEWYGSEEAPPTGDLILGIAMGSAMFSVPCLVALILCRWTAWFAPLAMLVVAFLYSVFIAGTALSFGGPLLPAGICLLVAAIVRLPGKGPAGPVRRLTAAEVLGAPNDDGRWGSLQAPQP
jgi:hypothetical protein